MCQHQPSCPAAEDPDRDAALVVSAHPEQGWSLLCNGVVLFDDSGQLLPSGRAVRPRQQGPRPCPGSAEDDTGATVTVLPARRGGRLPLAG